LEGDFTVERALLALMQVHGDRIEVLSSALKSAKESKAFHYPERAMALMFKLGGPYWEALVDGKADGIARQIFGEAHASTESETVMKNQRARKLRTFQYKGSDVELLAHLKIGVKDSKTETWRLHFGWFADDKKIVIGHCGPHLDHS
jgi:hypothetical protein